MMVIAYREISDLEKDNLGLYVDVENLMDTAKEAITSVFEQWPEELPRPCVLKLYVKADQTELWRVWATHKFGSLDIHVAGVQHYAVNTSKNSADIALALDAITDILKGRTTYVAILSDDSDFATLFGKITHEFPRLDNARFPFIWFMTDRVNTRSSILDEFLPASYVKTVVCNQKEITASHKQTRTTTANDQSQNELIVQTILKQIPVGPFKSADCFKLIKQQFPEHPLAKLDSAKFGAQFVKTLWPILEQYGARVTNPKRGPRRYEMTEEARNKIISTNITAK